MRDPVSSSDPYAVLGLAPGASAAEVKRAYRRLAKAYHPDSAGEAAIPRFLAIHEAYEAIRTGQPMSVVRRAAGASGAGSGSTGRSGGAEPWRADPDRARAARERARRGTSGPSAGAGAGAAAGARASGTSGTAGARTGAGGASSRGGATGTSGTAGTTGSKPRGKRATRKATMGSTSYDDARDPNDATWSGASWYGPSTGEYWIVNPREYADPRKHGPEYQSRARRTATAAGGAGTAAPEVDEPLEARATADAGEAWTFPSDETEPATTSGSTRRPAATAGRADRPGRSEWASAAGARQRTNAQDSWTSQWPGDARSIRRSGGGLGSFPRDWLGAPADDPIRRLGIALVAWPPIGLAAAAAIGDVTGCATYSAACGGSEAVLPWLAQAGILGVLLLLAPLARLLAAGTVGVILALLPVTFFLLVVGASGAPQAGFALAVLLGFAWLVGIGAALAARRRRGAGSQA